MKDLTISSGQPGRLVFNLTGGAASLTPVGWIAVTEYPGAKPVATQMQWVAADNALYLPPMPFGCFFYEVRVGALEVAKGHIDVTPSPFPYDGQEYKTWVVTDGDIVNDVATFNIDAAPGLQGPQGEKGEKGDPGSSVVLDAKPTSGSGNGVTSGGVYDADLHVSLGTDSMAVGKGAVANNAYSVAMGDGAATGAYYLERAPQATLTIVSTDRTNSQIWKTPCFATAVGYHATAARGGCSAYGAYASAGSDQSTASGSYATASGSYATASGDCATASGDCATASGSYATASGSYATASGDCATASGDCATASGDCATASGYSATASGYSATASGYSATASGDCATALGMRTNATGLASTTLGVIGRNNEDGCVVLAALGCTAVSDCSVENGQITQLYLIPAGSPAAEAYCEGEAGLGFITTQKGVDMFSEWTVLASGTRKLSELLTDNKNTFAPSLELGSSGGATC